jgi:hypothetical protein
MVRRRWEVGGERRILLVATQLLSFPSFLLGTGPGLVTV